MFIFSVSSFSCSCIFLFFHHVCVFVIVWVSLSLLHSFVVFFSVCLCVLMVWLLLCRSLLLCLLLLAFRFLGWRFPLDTSLSHSRRVTRSTIYFHLLSHTTAANFSSLSLSCFSFCFNSSSTALTISFIRFVLIDFYGFCYLLLFASLFLFCFSSQFLPY